MDANLSKHVWDQLFTVITIWSIGKTGDIYFPIVIIHIFQVCRKCLRVRPSLLSSNRIYNTKFVSATRSKSPKLSRSNKRPKLQKSFLGFYFWFNFLNFTNLEKPLLGILFLPKFNYNLCICTMIFCIDNCFTLKLVTNVRMRVCLLS